MKMKKKTKTIIVIALALVVVASTVAMVVLQNTNENVQSYTVSTSAYSDSIQGTGYLSYYDVQEVNLYTNVTLSSTLVSTGSVVSVGDGLATVSASSLYSAITSCQSAITKLDESIASSESTTSVGTVTAPISGRVKEIFASTNEDVQTTISEYGKLMTLSIDGYMAVEFELSNATYKNGDSVYITLTSTGQSVEGTVKSVVGTTYKIVISDEYGIVGEDVYITSTGDVGTLYINSPIEILASSGTVEEIKVSLNQSVASGRTLLVLNDVTESSDYSEDIELRAEYTAELATMVSALQNNTILSPYDGVVSYIASTGGTGASYIAGIASAEYMTVSTQVNELDITSVYVGMPALVTVDALDTVVSGTVTAISSDATTSTTTTSYTVYVLVDRTSSMYSGMSTTVELQLGSSEDVIMVPIDALSEDEDGVYVYTNSGLSKKQYITLGGVSSVFVEVTDGLAVGDVIYYDVTVAESEYSSQIPEISTTTDAMTGMTGMTGTTGDMAMSGMTGMTGGTTSGMTGMTGRG